MATAALHTGLRPLRARPGLELKNNHSLYLKQSPGSACSDQCGSPFRPDIVPADANTEFSEETSQHS